MRRARSLIPFLLPLLAACAAQAASQTNMLSPAERADGWQLLFDGTSLAAWRGYHMADMPKGWEVVDGALTRTGPGGDIITRQQYGDFELALDWKISEGGNSGVFYRVTEDGDYGYYTGPEMQVLDDARHADGKNPLTSAGACYGLYAAPRGVVKPAGEWNSARIVVRGNHVEHWLNGQKVVSYELGSPEWAAKVAASKFAQWPGYGKAARGYIALQDHGDWVAYRNIRIRELK